MVICKIICICVSVLIAADAVIARDSNDEEVNYRLPNHTRPLLYDLKLNPHLTSSDFTFDGEVFIDIDILNRTKTLTLHSKGLIIAENTIFLKSKVALDFYTPTTYKHNNITKLLTLGFDEDLLTGHYILYLNFSGVLNDKKYGFYKDSYTKSAFPAKEKIWYAGTNFKGTHARAAFPCWDEPALRATFKISIKHDRNYTAISNMPISKVSEVDESDGKVWTHFEESPVMSTYLVSFLISDIRDTSNFNGINFWTGGIAARLVDLARDTAEKVAIELERYTNNSVPVVEVDRIAPPDLLGMSAKTLDLITYRENTVTYDLTRTPLDEERRVAYNVIDRMSYQWLDNVVTPSWWTNTWMNGGLAEYLKHYIFNKEKKDSQFSDLTVVELLNSILFADTFYLGRLNFEPNTPEEINWKFSTGQVNKAFLLLRMLSHCLSDDVFQAGLIKYFNKHKYGVVEPEDLWSALQEALDESTVLQNKFNVQEVMNTWIGQDGYPLVTVTTDYETGRIEIRQEHFQPYKEMTASKNTNNTNASNKKWWIPINFATRTNPDFSSTLPTHWLSPKDEVLVIEGVDPLDWIIVNIQQTGFYRVDYDETRWLKIADYMYSENYQKIPVLNRAQIIHDAIFLMLSQKMNPLHFMEVTKYLRNETDPSAWYPMLKFMKEATRYSFVCNESGEMLRPYILDLMNNFIEAVGVHDNPDEDYFTRIIRNEILEETCAFDHPECLREAHAQLMTYLENNTVTHSLHLETLFHNKIWMFCNGVKQANETVWNKLLKQEENNDFLLTFCFGYSKNLMLSQSFLHTMLKNDSVIGKEEVHRVMYSILNADFPLYVDVILNFTISYWDKLVTIVDNPTNLLSDISWNIASREQVHKVKAFLNNVGIDVPRNLKIQEENIKLAEMIMTKIRLWLKLRNVQYTKSELIDLFHQQCEL